jgi:steroid delta-isomerase-like uncharacterized protein
MGEQETIRVARRSVEVFNAGDWRAVEALLTADSVYEEVGTGRTLRGARENVEVLRGWKAAFPDARGTITNALASGDTAVLEVTWQGTHSGDLATPMGTVPATGRTVTVKAAMVIEVENGRVKAERHYLDAAGMLSQLGLGASATA